MWYVYKMVEISTDEILYIGCTSNPQQRRESHRCDRFSKRGYLEVISRHRMRDVALRKEKRSSAGMTLHSTEPTSQHCRRSLGEIIVGPTGVERSLLVREGMLPVERPASGG